jgi:uncharacterized coiled-coil protein SlyX
MECQFCKNSFKNRSSLNIHQKQAVYCLKLQGSQSKLNCKFCEKSYSDKRRLLSHEEKCDKQNLFDPFTLNKRNIELEKKLKELEETIIKQEKQIVYLEAIKIKNDEIIAKQDSQISDLTSKLKDIAVVGAKKHTHNNTINLEILSDSHLLECANKLTANDILNIENLAHFAMNNSLKNRVIATDRTRKTLSFKNENGLIVKDPKGHQIAQKFFTSIKDKDNVLKSARDEVFEEVNSVAQLSQAETDLVMSKMNMLIDIERGIKHISAGEEHKIKEEFVSILCNILK